MKIPFLNFPFLKITGLLLGLLLGQCQLRAQSLGDLVSDYDPVSLADRFMTNDRANRTEKTDLNPKAGQPPYVVGNGIIPSSYGAVKGVSFTLPTAYAFADPEGGPLTYFLGGSANGITINPNTGVISGPALSVGLFGVTVGATDDEGKTAYSGFVLTVKNTGGITSPQSATVGIPYSTTTANAFFGAPYYQLGYTSSSLPPGLNLNGISGVISGTPAASGRFGITVAGTNVMSGAIEYQGFFLDIALNPAINLPPYVVGRGLSSPQSATVGAPLSISTASAFVDPEGRPLTFTSSQLPVGLSLNATMGVISGTPTIPGQEGITVGATDDGNRTVYSGFYLQSNTNPPTNLPPIIINGLQTPLVRLSGTALSIPTAYAFADPEGHTLTYSSNSLPAGLSLNTSTGVISGTVLAGGRYEIAVGATDDGGSTVYSGFFLTINLPPYVVGAGLTSPISVTVGVPLSIPTAYAFADPEGRPLTFTSSGNGVAQGLSLNPTTGVISGTPVSAIRAGVTIFATDDLGASVSSGFYLLTPGQSVGGGRVGGPISPEAGSGFGLQVVVLGNPTLNEEVGIEIRGADGGPVWLRSFDSQGRQVSSVSIEETSTLVRTTVRVGSSSGLYYVQVTTPGQQETVPILKH